MMVTFSETYLFKIHALSNALDKVFNQTLRRYSGITLSQFVLLLTISQHGKIHQRAAAKFLSISPAAVNRQAEIGTRLDYITFAADNSGRGQNLELTPKGGKAIESGIKALEKHVFEIFRDEDTPASLMVHLDMLLANTKTVLNKPNNDNSKEARMSDQIPKARKLFRGDINDAVIKVQKLTGIEITPSWWNQHVGNGGSTESILDRFDRAYAEEVAKRRKKP